MTNRWVRKHRAKNGTITWRAYARDGQGRTGRQVSLGTYSTEQDARDAALQGATRLQCGGTAGDGAVTFHAFSLKLMEEGHWKSLSETEAVRSRLHNHVWSTPSVPGDEGSRPLGALPLVELTRQHFKGLVATLNGKGRALPVRPVGKTKTRRAASEATAARERAAPKPLAPKTIHNIMATVSSILKAAVDEERIPTNPVSSIPLPDQVQRVKPSLDTDGARLLLKTVAQDFSWWLPVMAADLELGCRWGELIGLQAGDLVDGKIHLQRVIGESTVFAVARAVREGRLEPSAAAGRYYLKDRTKSNEDRLVAVSPAFVALWERTVHERDLAGDSWMFQTRDGGFPSRSTFISRVVRPALRQAGLDERLRTHDLRGACASLLLANGSEPLYVMERQGWKSMQTVARYRQVQPEDEAKATSFFDELLGGA